MIKKASLIPISTWIKVILLMVCILLPEYALSQVPVPDVNIQLRPSTSPQEVGLTLQIIILLAVFSLAPSLVIMMTSFIRIMIVLSFVRTALGTQNVPPSQVIMGLSLFLTLFVMTPTFTKIYENAWKPYSESKNPNIETFYDDAIEPIREFMFAQMERNPEQGIRSIDTFLKLNRTENRPETSADIPTSVLIPAFMTFEVSKAFDMGIRIFIPFLLIDLIVASILMAMGMIMLPPVMIALPFKIMLFVFLDGWNLIVTNLVQSFSF